MEWRKANKKSSDYVNILYEIPNRWLHIHYYEALNLLFRIENSLRIFVYIILKINYFDKWHEISVETLEEKNTSISSIAKKRIKQAQDFGYLGYEISSPLMHLNSGELVRLITSDSYWEKFSHYFKGRKEIIKNKLDEIGSIRNSLAHFRPIREDDVEILKQNSKHTLLAIETCLSEIISNFNIVPTNTNEEWYNKFITSGTSNCNISLSQSNSTEWVRITLTFKCRILQTNRYSDDWLIYNILNLHTSEIIRHYPVIKKYVIFISEYIPYTVMPDDLTPIFTKTVVLIFNKKVMIDNLKSIYDSFKKMLSEISKEEDLIANDNLAKGNLIETVSITAQHREKEDRSWWDIHTDALKIPFKEDDPAEYWGDVGFYERDFIAATTKYPWMPSPVSYT